MKVTIGYRFTSLNDYIRIERGNRHVAAKVKKEETEAARLHVLDRQPIREYPVIVSFTWHRKNERTDPDNIAFAAKFILDGFVQAGVLRGDTWKDVSEIHHTFRKSSSDCVTVEIEPCHTPTK